GYNKDYLNGLEKAKTDELRQVNDPKAREQINQRYDRLINEKKQDIADAEVFAKQNNTQYWKEISERKPDVQKPLISDNERLAIHNDNI
ncbi:hypothetical protein, partial [Caballeronia sp. GAOx1]|uniref:hypothetical protein n=1 Tax=Caballeronia sp. GAOx1 TaxID=2921761 RepID=UPI002028641A